MRYFYLISTIVFLTGCASHKQYPRDKMDAWSVGLQRLVPSMQDLTLPDQFVNPIQKDLWDKALVVWAERRPERRGEAVDCDDFVAAFRAVLIELWAEAGDDHGLPVWEGEVVLTDGSRHRLALVVLAGGNGQKWELKVIDPETLDKSSPQAWDWAWIKG